MPEIHLFTDGGCSGNPGPGGWAFLMRHLASGKELESSGAAPETTNNRMELTAVVEGLKALKRATDVELFTDSVYVGKGMSEWMPKWKANGWRRREGKKWAEVKNVDLWQQLDSQLQQHKVKYTLRRRAQRTSRERPCRRTRGSSLPAISLTRLQTETDSDMESPQSPRRYGDDGDIRGWHMLRHPQTAIEEGLMGTVSIVPRNSP